MADCIYRTVSIASMRNHNPCAMVTMVTRIYFSYSFTSVYGSHVYVYVYAKFTMPSSQQYCAPNSKTEHGGSVLSLTYAKISRQLPDALFTAAVLRSKKTCTKLCRI